jgi:hypothetical protein
MLEKKHLLIIGLIFCLCWQSGFAFSLPNPQLPEHQNQFDTDFKDRYKAKK